MLYSGEQILSTSVYGLIRPFSMQPGQRTADALLAKEDEPWLHLTGSLKTLNMIVASMSPSEIGDVPTITTDRILLDLNQRLDHTDLERYVSHLETYIDSKIREVQGPAFMSAASEELSALSSEEKQQLVHQFELARRFVSATTDVSKCTE